MLKESDNGILDQQIQQINEIIKTQKELISKKLREYLESLTTTYLPILKGVSVQERENTINMIIITLNQNFQGEYQVEETIYILCAKTLKPLDTEVKEAKYENQFELQLNQFKERFNNIAVKTEINLEDLQKVCTQLEDFGWDFINKTRKEFADLSEKFEDDEFVAQFNICAKNHNLLRKVCLEMSKNYAQKTQGTTFGLHALILSMDWECLKLKLLSEAFNEKNENSNFFRLQFSVIFPLSRVTPAFSSSSTPHDSKLLVEAIQKIKVPQIPVTSEPYDMFWIEINDFLQGLQSLALFDLHKLESDSFLKAIAKLFRDFDKACRKLCETANNQIKISRKEFLQSTSSTTQSLVYQYVPMVMGTFSATLCIKTFLKDEWDIELSILDETYNFLLTQNKSLQQEVFSLENIHSTTQMKALFSNFLTRAPLFSYMALTFVSELVENIPENLEKSFMKEGEDNEEDDEEENEEDEKDIMTRMREGYTSEETLMMINSSFIDPTTPNDTFCEELKNAGNEYLQQFGLEINTAILEEKSSLDECMQKAIALKNFYEKICAQYSDNKTNSFVRIESQPLLDLVNHCDRLIFDIRNAIKARSETASLSNSQASMFSSSSSSSSSFSSESMPSQSSSSSTYTSPK